MQYIHMAGILKLFLYFLPVGLISDFLAFPNKTTDFHVLATITAIVKIEALFALSLLQLSLKSLNGNFHTSALISKLNFFPAVSTI